MSDRTKPANYTIFKQSPVESVAKYHKVIGELNTTPKQPKRFEQTYNAPKTEPAVTPDVKPNKPVMSYWNLLHGCRFRDVHNPLRAQEFFWSYWWSNRPQACNCKDSFSILEAIGGMDFSTDDAFFESGVRLHNGVNKKLQLEYPEMVYPQMDLEEAYVLWRMKFPHKSTKAIVTVANGQDFKKLLTITGPTHKAYASRVGADYLALTNKVYDDWKIEKFRAGLVAKEYAQTLFVDADVIIRESCPDIFTKHGVSIHDDFPRLKNRSWCDAEIERLAVSQSVDPWKADRCLNTGFFTCTSESNPWVMPKNPFPDTHCAEQWWIDRHITDFHQLDSSMNWQWWFYDFWDGLDDAHVVHLANCPNEIRLLAAKEIMSGITAKELKEKFENQWMRSSNR